MLKGYRSLTGPTPPQIMAFILVLLSLPTLWFPWFVGGIGNEATASNAFTVRSLGTFVGLMTASTTVAMGYASFRRTQKLTLILLLGGLAAIPGVLMISLVEFAQSLVPGWLTPVLTNSAALTLRAGSGVWLHTGLVVAALTLWATAPSMMSDNQLTSPRRAKGRLLLLLTAIAIPILRSFPLFTLTVTRGANTVEGPRLAVVNIVSGEVPVLGLVSTIAMLIFISLAVASVVYPQPLLLIGASTGLGLHLGIIWLQVISVSAVTSVIPDSWSGVLQGWAAVDVSLRATALATLAVSAVGFFAMLLAISGSLTLGSAQRDQPTTHLQDDLP